MRELDVLALLVFAQAEFEVGIRQLAKYAIGSVGHLVLHRQELFFGRAQCMRFIPYQSFKCQPEAVQRLGGQVFLELLSRQGENLGPDETGRLGRVSDGVIVAADHPLIIAVGHILGRLQMGVAAQPLAGPFEIAVKRQALGQCSRAIAERAAELRVLGDFAFPFLERLLPLGVVLEQARQVPRVGRFDVAAGGKFFGFGHQRMTFFNKISPRRIAGG